ncbi:AMP-binding protein [Corynebacterium sphenisci]|uniref:AMP-binding protein n=1 Tax=Corynebacterium sphenisci TaxID=191493 RepID=UPI0026DEDB45|nr:AMP-binding protein [Corynebacterium sphenisci]MDO5731610.1 AMP-binding protein [Corynebacterium sphenisci]
MSTDSTPAPRIRDRVRGASEMIRGLGPVTRAGVLGSMGPGALGKAAHSLYRWDFLPSGLLGIAAGRDPHHTAIIDDGGSMTYEHFNDRANQLARALRHGNIRPRDRIGVLSRNHRGFLLALCAHGRLGTDLVLLNPGASAEQTNAVIREQKLDFLFIDEEFTHILPEDFDQCPVAVSWLEDYEDTSCVREGWTSMRDMIRTAPPEDFPGAALLRRPRRGRVIILTSGTTGTPKGAKRPEPRSWMPASSIMSAIPLRQRRPAYLAAPLFHTWGFATVQLSIALRSTMILRRHFDPEDSLRIIEAHHPHTVFLVPTMLQRMLEAAPEKQDVDSSSLQVIASCGSAIPKHIVELTLERFGPVLYNQYGSTEVSWATIAGPEDLAAEPTTAGRPPLGTRLSIRDEDGAEVPAGEVGRIFIGNSMLYEGYTRPGADKEIIDGMVCTGDLGYIDEAGLLYVSGREDDMIVSGGENVFPRETEDVLSGLAGVRECAVVGAPDARFGQALVAYVVRADDAAGAALTHEDLREYVKTKLTRYNVPRETVFMEELPRNAVGKVVPRMLPEPAGSAGTAA